MSQGPTNRGGEDEVGGKPDVALSGDSAMGGDESRGEDLLDPDDVRTLLDENTFVSDADPGQVVDKRAPTGGRNTFDERLDQLTLMKRAKDLAEKRDATAEELLPILEELLEKLRRSDSVVALSLLLSEIERERKSMNTLDHIAVGAFKLAHPSLKSLNDVLLGYDDADEFLKELRTCMTGEIGEVMKVFYGKASQNHFVLDYDACKEKWREQITLARRSSVDSEEVIIHKILDEKIKQIQESMNQKLFEFMRTALDKELVSFQKASEITGSSAEVGDASGTAKRLPEDIKWKITNLIKAMQGIANGKDRVIDVEVLSRIDGLSDLEDVVERMPESFNGVKLSFGIVGPEHGAHETDRTKRLALMIAVSVLATNMNDMRLASARAKEDDMDGADTFRGSAKKNRLSLQPFAPTFLIRDLYNARISVEKECMEGGVVLDEYKQFFEMVDGVPMLRPEIINQYRKERSTRKYTGVLIDSRYRKILREYYTALNMLDYLKNYTLNDFDHYRDKVAKVIPLCERLATSMKSKVKQPTIMRNQMSEALDCLEVAFKDRGDEIRHEVRGALKLIMNDRTDDSVAVGFGDHIGFGARNIREFEVLSLKLLRIFGLSDQEKLMVESGRRSISDFIGDHVIEAFKDPEKVTQFYDELIGAGDSGTEHLRDAEAALHEVLSDDVEEVKIIPGGDECTLVMRRKLSTPWPVIMEKLKGIANQYKMRIALKVLGANDGSSQDIYVSPAADYLRGVADVTGAVDTEKSARGSEPFAVQVDKVV